MKMKLQIIIIIFVSVSVFVAACGGGETSMATPKATELLSTSTPDLCSSENLPDEVAKINKFMREFDDYSVLASNTPQAQLVVVIPDLQRVLRDAEDQSVPVCLESLKKAQISYMQIVVQTLIAFIGNSDAALVNSGISRARELHATYDIELAQLLGITLVVSTPPPATPTGVVGTTPAPTGPVFMVTNPGPNGVNLRKAPDLNASGLGILAVQASTLAFGKTADNLWILVEIPGQSGQTAWVYSTLVQLSVPFDQLPVVTP